MQLRAIVADDYELIRRFVLARWMSDLVVVHDTVYEPAQLPGFLCFDGEQVVGLLTYSYQRDTAIGEIVSLDSVHERCGIGSMLLHAFTTVMRTEGGQRVRVFITNDNLTGLRFLQKRGFRLVNVHRNAVDRARKLKPAIPVLGEDGIAVHDEIELELDPAMWQWQGKLPNEYSL